MLSTRGCTFLLLGVLFACASPHPVTRTSLATAEAELLQKEIERLARYQMDLAANVALLACGPESRIILEELRSQCRGFLNRSVASKSQHLTSPSSTVPGSPSKRIPVREIDELTPCPANVVNETVPGLEDSLGVEVSRQLYAAPHQVIYFADTEPSLGQDRETRLLELLAVPLMKSTKLLLITSPDRVGRGAEQRFNWAIKWLNNHDVPASSIDRPLEYNLGIPPTKLSPHDRHSSMEPGDLAHALWIFRVNC